MCSDKADTVKGLLHICITCPMAVFHNIHPYLEWKKRIRMYLCKLFQCLFSKYPHVFLNFICKSKHSISISLSQFSVFRSTS